LCFFAFCFQIAIFQLLILNLEATVFKTRITAKTDTQSFRSRLYYISCAWWVKLSTVSPVIIFS